MPRRRLQFVLVCSGLMLAGGASADPWGSHSLGLGAPQPSFDIAAGASLLRDQPGSRPQQVDASRILSFPLLPRGAEASLASPAWEFGARAGLMRQYDRGFGTDFNQYNLSLDAVFIGFPWHESVRTRFGISEGVSYADSGYGLDPNDDAGPATTRLMNHLDVSLDFNVGDLFRARPLDNCYLGFSISHRTRLQDPAQLLDPDGDSYGWRNLNFSCATAY